MQNYVPNYSLLRYLVQHLRIIYSRTVKAKRRNEVKENYEKLLFSKNTCRFKRLRSLFGEYFSPTYLDERFPYVIERSITTGKVNVFIESNTNSFTVPLYIVRAIRIFFKIIRVFVSTKIMVSKFRFYWLKRVYFISP